jgi:hypothetical protein
VTGKGKRVAVDLTDKRKLGIATYGAMSEYMRIVDFMNFLKSWYLRYFSPDSAHQLQQAASHVNGAFIPFIPPHTARYSPATATNSSSAIS